MELYKQTFKNFIKNRILWILLALYILIELVQLVYFAYLAVGVEMTLLDHTRRILFLCPEIMSIFVIIGYEFFSEIYRKNIEECVEVTTEGFKKRLVRSQFVVMASVLFLVYIVFVGIDFVLTGISFETRGITENTYTWISYLAGCLFVNIFLIGLIGILLGLLFSKIRQRIFAYSAIMVVVFASSYLLNTIASLVLTLTDFKVNLFTILGILNIMTPGLNFLPNTAFGFSMMDYRICLLLFWITLLSAIILIRESRKKISLRNGICVLMCVMFFVGYVLPTSKVDMSVNKIGTAMADQYYYENPKHRVKEVKADFCVEEYKMDLRVGRLLKAKVEMDLSDYREVYPFTLSHSYKIHKIDDADGNPLQFKHESDSLMVYNRGTSNKQIIIEYEGANEAYYANSQGMNLRGSFPYYPIPGVRTITGDGMFMNALFLEEDAEFEVHIKTRKKVFSNLEEKEKGCFAGTANGVTLLSGLYTETVCNGIRIVSPIFNGWDDENFEEISKAAVTDGYGNCQIFITPNVNRQDDAVSKEQIITRNYFMSVKDDLN